METIKNLLSGSGSNKDDVHQPQATGEGSHLAAQHHDPTSTTTSTSSAVTSAHDTNPASRQAAQVATGTFSGTPTTSTTGDFTNPHSTATPGSGLSSSGTHTGLGGHSASNNPGGLPVAHSEATGLTDSRPVKHGENPFFSAGTGSTHGVQGPHQDQSTSLPIRSAGDGSGGHTGGLGSSGHLTGVAGSSTGAPATNYPSSTGQHTGVLGTPSSQSHTTTGLGTHTNTSTDGSFNTLHGVQGPHQTVVANLLDPHLGSAGTTRQENALKHDPIKGGGAEAADHDHASATQSLAAPAAPGTSASTGLPISSGSGTGIGHGIGHAQHSDGTSHSHGGLTGTGIGTGIGHAQHSDGSGHSHGDLTGTHGATTSSTTSSSTAHGQHEHPEHHLGRSLALAAGAGSIAGGGLAAVPSQGDYNNNQHTPLGSGSGATHGTTATSSLPHQEQTTGTGLGSSTSSHPTSSSTHPDTHHHGAGAAAGTGVIAGTGYAVHEHHKHGDGLGQATPHDSATQQGTTTTTTHHSTHDKHDHKHDHKHDGKHDDKQHHTKDTALGGGVVGAAAAHEHDKHKHEHGKAGTHATSSSSSTMVDSTNPAPNTTGPHRHDWMNKLDPRVKSHPKSELESNSNSGHAGRDAAMVGGVGATAATAAAATSTTGTRHHAHGTSAFTEGDTDQDGKPIRHSATNAPGALHALQATAGHKDHTSTAGHDNTSTMPLTASTARTGHAHDSTTTTDRTAHDSHSSSRGPAAALATGAAAGATMGATRHGHGTSTTESDFDQHGNPTRGDRHSSVPALGALHNTSGDQHHDTTTGSHGHHTGSAATTDVLTGAKGSHTQQDRSLLPHGAATTESDYDQHGNYVHGDRKSSVAALGALQKAVGGNKTHSTGTSAAHDPENITSTTSNNPLGHSSTTSNNPLGHSSTTSNNPLGHHNTTSTDRSQPSHDGPLSTHTHSADATRTTGSTYDDNSSSLTSVGQPSRQGHHVTAPDAHGHNKLHKDPPMSHMTDTAGTRGQSEETGVPRDGSARQALIGEGKQGIDQDTGVANAPGTTSGSQY